MVEPSSDSDHIENRIPEELEDHVAVDHESLTVFVSEIVVNQRQKQSRLFRLSEDITSNHERYDIEFDVPQKKVDIVKDNKVQTREGAEESQKLLENVIKTQVKKNASDIHIYEQENHVDIYNRVWGDYKHFENLPKKKGRRLGNTVMNADIDEGSKSLKRSEAQDGLIRNKDWFPSDLLSIRIATWPCYGDRLNVNLRLLRKQYVRSDGITHLGWSQAHEQELRKIMNDEKGLIFLAGVTGAGKSTTLANFLNWLYQIRKPHIVTAEDPVEYILADGNAKQRSLDIGPGDDREAIWRRAVYESLRNDPDVMLIGETRELGTAKAVKEATATGHLTTTTIHTPSAIKTISRLDDLGMDIKELTDHRLISAIMHQDLVGVLCDECKAPAHKHVDEYERTHGYDLERWLECDGDVFVRGDYESCTNEDCYKGIVGREVVGEVLCPDDHVFDLIARREYDMLKQYWHSELRTQTREQHGLMKIMDGRMSPYEVDNVLFDSINLENHREQVA